LVLEDVARIANGTPSRVLYDCKQGLWGDLANEDDDPTKAQTLHVQKGTRAFANYLSMCRTVTNEEPYVAEIREIEPNASNYRLTAPAG
jgi:hypothetical protein